jgi:hypothetical protein
MTEPGKATARSDKGDEDVVIDFGTIAGETAHAIPFEPP